MTAATMAQSDPQGLPFFKHQEGNVQRARALVGNRSRVAVAVAELPRVDAADAVPIDPVLIRVTEAPRGPVLEVDHFGPDGYDLVWTTRQSEAGFEVRVALVPNDGVLRHQSHLAASTIPLPGFLRPGADIVVVNRDGSTLHRDQL